jgi:hypothetical protein
MDTAKVPSGIEVKPIIHKMIVGLNEVLTGNLWIRKLTISLLKVYVGKSKQNKNRIE